MKNNKSEEFISKFLEVPVYTEDQLELITQYCRKEWSIKGIQYDEDSNPKIIIILQRD